MYMVKTLNNQTKLDDFGFHISYKHHQQQHVSRTCSWNKDKSYEEINSY
jgi:hypothetical protein